ncbi:hypothetical protein TBR22_A06020 [Luteitalea sp. TBR-22]|nr:hypothetical protein TBR22_A06020 [Luteitalea sp. TBR-22]
MHVLALGNGVDRALLTRIARATGGQIAYAREARDLVVGFLSVARLLGRQWLLFDRLVSPGRVSVPLPAWATEYQAVFIPQSGEATLSAPGAEAARRAANYAYLIGPGHAGPVEMQVGGAGRLLVQAPGDLVLNARMPAVAPRDVFFPCAVRLEPTRAGGLGTPAFLGGATVSLRLGADTFALYDDGKHDDGGVSDGAFGGRCRSAGTGALFWSATLAAPVLDPPSASGSIEVLASPLNVRDPGIFSGWLDASLHRTPRVWFDNPTDVQVDGRLEAGTWHLDVAMAPRSSLEARLPFTGAAFATRREPVVLVQEGRTVPLGGVRVRPSWLVPAVLALVGAMVGVLLRWPQSIAGSTLLVTGTHRDGPERSFSAVATIDEGGVPRFSAQAPPPPFDTPGTFRAVPGARQQKTDFVPRAGQVPMFTASIRGRAGMFRLGRNASWRISADGFSVTYTFNRK